MRNAQYIASCFGMLFDAMTADPFNAIKQKYGDEFYDWLYDLPDIIISDLTNRQLHDLHELFLDYNKDKSLQDNWQLVSKYGRWIATPNPSVKYMTDHTDFDRECQEIQERLNADKTHDSR